MLAPFRSHLMTPCDVYRALTCMSILTLTIVMTKRRDIFKTIAAAAKRQGFALGLEREGASHSVYNLGGLMIPIGRHMRNVVPRNTGIIWSRRRRMYRPWEDLRSRTVTRPH